MTTSVQMRQMPHPDRLSESGAVAFDGGKTLFFHTGSGTLGSPASAIASSASS